MVINPIIGFYIPIIRIPSLKVGWVYPQTKRLLTMAHIIRVDMNKKDDLEKKNIETVYGNTFYIS